MEMKREKTLIMTVLTSPDMVNFSGKVHGGAMLKLLDQVAYACASRYSGCYVVTVSVDHVVFKQPTHLGELVTFYSHVNHTGKSSMEIGIKVVTENPRTGVSKHVMSCFFTMVAVDEKGAPCVLPTLVIDTEMEQKLWDAAILRKKIKEEYEAAFAATMSKSKSSKAS